VTTPKRPQTIGAAARVLGVSDERTRQLADAGELGEVTRTEGGMRLLDPDRVDAAAARRDAARVSVGAHRLGRRSPFNAGERALSRTLERHERRAAARKAGGQ